MSLKRWPCSAVILAELVGSKWKINLKKGNREQLAQELKAGHCCGVMVMWVCSGLLFLINQHLIGLMVLCTISSKNVPYEDDFLEMITGRLI